MTRDPMPYLVVALAALGGAALVSCSPPPAPAGRTETIHPIPVAVVPVQAPRRGKVEVVRRGDGWQLLRDGAPCYVKGAGGGEAIERLVEAGGTSMRTWGAKDLQPLLDRAAKLGATVTVGIWLGHERHGFDYGDAARVEAQRVEALNAVRRYKDHPAVLMWGIGNEMEGFGDGSDARIWTAVDDIARGAKELDVNHPTMTVIVEVGGARVRMLNQYCPAIDVVGINSYGGVASIPQRYRAAGGTKPYIVTEYGPPGTWEVGRNSFGAVQEWTSTAKAAWYRSAYEALRADTLLCLGSYAFTWGSKQEATATWFGMFLPDGTRLGAVDALREAWTGASAPNRCPEIRSIAIDGSAEVAPGASVHVRLQATDPEGEALATSWKLHGEVASYETGGDAQATPQLHRDAIAEVYDDGVTVVMPPAGGTYRLFATVRDGHGGAATANVPLRVTVTAAAAATAAASASAPSRPRLPLVVYGDGVPAPYVPSGWMGDAGAISMDAASTSSPHAGATCLAVRFTKSTGWGGVVWQHPADDWGDRSGGFDLTGARTLRFYARGGRGGERVKFVFGLIKADKTFHDTAHGEVVVALTTSWTRYAIDLAGKDLSRIKTAFAWIVEATGEPVSFWIDDVAYVEE